MIILEGPDGAGKTTLLSNLLDEFPSIEEHARASTSVEGPLAEIHEWARTDLATQMLQPLSFYDRHPVFSEPVYGQIIRGNVHEWFSSEEAQQMGNSLLNNSLVVICLPPLDKVVNNLEAEGQMEGVIDNIGQIYGVYGNILTSISQAFPTNVFHYDYTVESDLDDLISVIAAHQTQWNRRTNGRLA